MRDPKPIPTSAKYAFSGIVAGIFGISFALTFIHPAVGIFVFSLGVLILAIIAFYIAMDAL